MTPTSPEPSGSRCTNPLPAQAAGCHIPKSQKPENNPSNVANDAKLGYSHRSLYAAVGSKKPASHRFTALATTAMVCRHAVGHKNEPRTSDAAFCRKRTTIGGRQFPPPATEHRRCPSPSLGQCGACSKSVVRRGRKMEDYSQRA